MKIPGINFHWGNGGELVAQRLYDLSIKIIISLPGSQVLPIWDGVSSRFDMQVVVPRSERNGAFMAEGYGQASGFPAVLMSTLGPGVANELIGVYSAKASETPVMCISPYHPPNKYSRLGEVFQGLDHPKFFYESCKENILIESNSAKELLESIDNTFATCLKNPCGPVRLDISFPILFQHGFHKVKKTAESIQPNVPPMLFIIKEDPSISSLLESIDFLNSKGEKRVLSPGIGQPGFGLPFALGVKLAYPKTPVVLTTTYELLMSHLDSFAVAQLYNLSIRVMGKDKTSDSIKQITNFFGMEYIKEPENKNDLERKLFERQDSLTVLLS